MISSNKGGQSKKPQSKIQRRLRAISGDQNDQESRVTAKNLQDKAKNNSFAMVTHTDAAGADIDDTETEI